ncbi:short-chain dehydrogenase [Penicillium daleae]|uniref:Short-chain dehydrogenase n=1 Tax=Penicillium daleae TaxID=63821 RepID=A0AAD6C5Z4_9EURO|nr:short-chain dehydrogenase [Penicillium daleae]KAJ5453422.1 short-chain dehydrogenase [Penicillium daleae]
MSRHASIQHLKAGDSEECNSSIWDFATDIIMKGVRYGSKFAVRILCKHKKKTRIIINTANIVVFVSADQVRQWDRFRDD